MEKLIAQFPKHISDALEIARDISFNKIAPGKFTNVVICGMGGSGIGGEMISQWFSQEAQVPISLVQSYQVPGFVDSKTLVIGSSYSGNTEETLSAIEDALEKGATIAGVCSGGKLYKFCKEHQFDVVKVPGGNPPRSMLAFSVVQLVNILAVAGIIEKEALSKIDHCRHLLNKELIQIKETAKELADFCKNKQVIIYTSSDNESIGIRCRQQINENAKQLCWHHVIPEMNHNELVGWGGGDDRYAVLFLKSQFLSERNNLRFKLSAEVIGSKTKHLMEINPKGDSIFEETFYLIHIIDWASIYLARHNNQDPVEIEVIDFLKGSLEKA